MTILEAILAADRLRDNDVSAAEKLRWLSALDGQIHKDVLTLHEGGAEEFHGYDAETDAAATALLVGAPWDELYPWYLVMRIALAQGEIERYNNAAALHRRLYLDYVSWYNRTHMPLARVGALSF